MKGALLALFALVREPLTRLLTSLKFWTLVIGATATWLAKKGIVLDPSMAQYIAEGFGLLLLGQGLQDHGKAAAQIHAGPLNAPAPTPDSDDVDTGEHHVS